ncbi:MAG: AAA-like domain-containing protein [Candidatus Poribacteria bacterium]|nr:AAA-like domain-containing protein [Candidatus Poribacteria bacterium]
MRYFETRGPVNPQKNYVVSRSEATADFIERIKNGRYIVLYAPRQTGKTTFFRRALDTLSTEDPNYFPIQLDFQILRNLSPNVFYERFYELVRGQIETVLRQRGKNASEELTQFLEHTQLTDSFSMLQFFKQLENLLGNSHVVVLIDEFDGIPETVVSDFLYTLRHIYLSNELHCPYSVGIVGVKSITQLNYDRSISPFNIQDDFNLSNFTLEQVQELLSQYTEEAGQTFNPEVIEMLHRQTGGQPFLVNRFAQILTEESDIPKTEPIRMEHFLTAHTKIVQEGNVNIQHLITNVRREPRFRSILMKIAAYEGGVAFNPYDDVMNELAIYGVITKGTGNLCEIVNPIYQQCILLTFRPLFNGLEHDYFPEDTDFEDYLTPTGHIDLERLLDNFSNFIARVGFRILQVPDTPQEFVGQDLLYTYLDQFVRIVRGAMYLEVQTGRGRIDLVIFHSGRKYIVETKIWEGEKRYQAGKKQLMTYLKLEQAVEGYYVVFDHRENPTPLVESETEGDVRIRSYVIPVIQERPSS